MAIFYSRVARAHILFTSNRWPKPRATRACATDGPSLEQHGKCALRPNHVRWKQLCGNRGACTVRWGLRRGVRWDLDSDSSRIRILHGFGFGFLASVSIPHGFRAGFGFLTSVSDWIPRVSAGFGFLRWGLEVVHLPARLLIVGCGASKHAEANVNPMPQGYSG